MSDLAQAIDSLPPLREVIAQNQLQADKKFGQNFILDQNITDKIARAAGRLDGVHVIEIGPGPGGLTRSLLRAGAASVHAIEFDPRAVRALASLRDAAAGRLEVITGDALRIDLRTLCPPPRAIVANLPYNIATPLLTGWLRDLRTTPACYQGMTLMFQKEVAERLAARPGNRTFGRLSVLAQWLCAVECVFDLPPSVFLPPPKVTSTVVRLTPRILEGRQPDFGDVEKLTAAAFGQRRKMLKSCLKAWPDLPGRTGIDAQKRAEQLTVAEFIRMAEAIGQSGQAPS